MMDDVGRAAAIDEPLRRRFEAAWIAGAPLAIEACLPPRDSPAYLPTLEELVLIELEFAWKAHLAPRQDHTWRQDWNSQPQPQPPRAEQYVERFPELNRLEILARLREQELLVRPQPGQPAAAAETMPAAPADQTTVVPAAGITLGTTLGGPAKSAQRFGNYELLDEIGRGGMGVVYRARQISAERIVALKVIHSDPLAALRPEQRASAVERFHQEALAAARLQHEHIVTIYEVGAVAGEPFFSMRYVEGASLADLLRTGPLAEDRAADYLEAVARAVAAAHEAGILHRDLKPQNILIESRTDAALVADFGLAKLLEQPGELTRAGDVMGTPSYMSPEQARDSSQVTAATDVYSLGATLYHALTGRPPFQSANVVETLRQVEDDEPVPPSRLNRAIGRDLETICLTCLRKEPERRYSSAEALADDLRRRRKGFPILARPTGPLERAVRWCRRNPLLGGALALAAAFLLAALVTAGVGYATTASALAGKTRALAESERSYQQSRDVVNQFFTLVSEDVLLDQPGTQPLRNDLLKLALAHYQRFLSERGAEPALLEEIARTHYRVALIQQATEPGAKAALPPLEEALRIQRELLARAPASEPLQEALSDTLNVLGQAKQRGGDTKEALKLLAESRQLRQQLVDRHPQRIEFVRKLANTIMNVGLIDKLQERFADAQRALEQSQSIRQVALPGRQVEHATAAEALLWRDLAMGHYNLANLALAMRQPAAAERELTPGIAVLEKLVKLTPNDLRIRERLAANYHLAARLRYDQRDDEQAGKYYEQAVAALEQLHQGSPQVVEYQERLALVQMDRGVFLSRRRNPQAALAAFSNACELLRAIAPPPESSEHPDRRRNYAVALCEQAREQHSLQQPADDAQLALSQKYLERLLEQTTDAAARKRLEGDLKQTRQVRAKLGK